jgi:hypothetical protein
MAVFFRNFASSGVVVHAEHLFAFRRDRGKAAPVCIWRIGADGKPVAAWIVTDELVQSAGSSRRAALC